MNLPLHQRVAIVTGGNSGIGRATCLALARAGAHVVAVGRNAERLAQVVERLNEIQAPLGTRALGLALDIQKESDASEMAERTLRTFGRIDLLVCSAAIVRLPGSRLAPATQTSLAEFEAVLNTNLRGTFLCNRAVLPAMFRQGAGDILNISSTSGTAGVAFDGPYCTSKFGVIGLTEALAEEAAAEGVRVQCLVPGHFYTEMWQEGPRGLIPTDKMPAADRAADAILYLLTLPEDTRLVNPSVQPFALETGSTVLGGIGASRTARSAEPAEGERQVVSPLSRLQGQVVLVTGGATGLGRAVCASAAREGARVLLADADAAGAEAAAVALPGTGHVGFGIDPTRGDDYENLVQTALERFGRIDSLVTAAEVYPAAEGIARPVAETPLADFEHVLALNLKSVYLANRAIVPVLAKQRGGVIVNVSSVLGLKGRANEGAYAASKFGVIGLSQSLADEVRSHGVRVQAFTPALLTTPHGGRLAPEDAADTITFLLAQPTDTTLSGTTVATLGARRRRGKVD
jgi:NAD(P)-dependent dehydrogenase (short-subunit alcohol dehydrogenase family)